MLAPVGTATAEAPEPSDGEIRRLERQLREPRPERRRRAVRDLADLGGDRAVEAVVSALSDRSAEVADQAQLCLPELLGPRLPGHLQRTRALHRGSPVLGARWAEALGRATGPVEARALTALRRPREPVVERALLWSVERLARRGMVRGDTARLVERVLRAARSRGDDGVRAAALQALVVLAPEEAEGLVPEWLASGGRERCCSALMAAVELRPPGLRDHLARAARHGDGGVRLRAAQLLGSWRHTASLEVLVERLREEERPAVRGAVLASLRGLTGLHHRAHPDAWERVLGGLPPGELASPSGAEPEGAETGGAGPGGAGPGATGASPRRAARSAATLRTLDPESDRIAILMDLSGSIWHEGEGGSRPKDELDRQVSALLQRLRPGATFTLAPYTDRPHPFEPRPVAATPRNLRRAERFLAGATMRGSGDLHRAIEHALDVDSTDRVLVLSDGAPSGGERWDVPLMISILGERLRFRPAVFDLVLVDSSPRLERLWGAFASSTGGRCLSLRSRGDR